MSKRPYIAAPRYHRYISTVVLIVNIDLISHCVYFIATSLPHCPYSMFHLFISAFSPLLKQLAILV